MSSPHVTCVINHVPQSKFLQFIPVCAGSMHFSSFSFSKFNNLFKKFIFILLGIYFFRLPQAEASWISPLPCYLYFKSSHFDPIINFSYCLFPVCTKSYIHGAGAGDPNIFQVFIVKIQRLNIFVKIINNVFLCKIFFWLFLLFLHESIIDRYHLS